MTGDRRRFPGLRVPIHRMAAALTKKSTAFGFQMPREIHTFHTGRLGSLDVQWLAYHVLTP